ncbi:hypothetical protein [Rhizobium sp.]
MAKIKYFSEIETVGFVFQDNAYGLSVAKSGKKAVWTDDGTDVRIVLEGTGLKASKDDDNALSAGKITGLEVYGMDGKIVVDVANLNIKATKLSAALEDGNLISALYFFTSGNDKVVGTNKGETVFSGGGDDILTGRGGSDIFAFQAPAIPNRGFEKSPGRIEHDVITDFDTTGPDADYLYFDQDMKNSKGVNKGQDTLIKFDDGSTLLLEDVTWKQFQKYLDEQSQSD